jgi:hypothetical protein
VSLTKGLRLRRRGASRRRQRGKCKIIEANEKSPSETGAAGRLDAGSGTQRIKCAATRRRREGNQRRLERPQSFFFVFQIASSSTDEIPHPSAAPVRQRRVLLSPGRGPCGRARSKK